MVLGSFFQDAASLAASMPSNLASLMNNSGLVSKSVDRNKAKMDHETPQQKQAAAKLALRKQLEKTLLQVEKSKRNDVYK